MGLVRVGDVVRLVAGIEFARGVGDCLLSLEAPPGQAGMQRT